MPDPEEPLDPPIWGVGRWGHFKWAGTAAPTPPTPPILPQIKPTKPKPMNDPLQNQLNMIGACLAFANEGANLAVWQNQPPLDLTEEMATLATLHAAATATAAQLAGGTSGATEGKDAAETILENSAYLLSRAVFQHCRKTGDAENAGKVNFTKSAIVRLRDQDLLATATAIRDLAQAKSAETDAAKRGITAAGIAALTAAIAAYAGLINVPRARIGSLSALRRELATQVAACMTAIGHVDDFILQLTTPGAPAFIAGWKQNRLIVDAGHGPGEEEPPQDPPTPPTP